MEHMAASKGASRRNVTAFAFSLALTKFATIRLLRLGCGTLTQWRSCLGGLSSPRPQLPSDSSRVIYLFAWRDARGSPVKRGLPMMLSSIGTITPNVFVLILHDSFQP